MNETPKQLSLFDQFQDVNIEHWESIRRAEIDGVMHYSILDIFKFYGDTKNYRQEWNTVLGTLEKQGFRSSIEIIQHRFEGQGQRDTPIAPLEVFLRIAQVTTFKHWESIRRAMSGALAEKIESAKERKLRTEIEKYDKAGLGDRPEIVHLKARSDNLATLKMLRDVISQMVDSPDWGMIFKTEYREMFGTTATQMKILLDNKSVRDALPTLQLDTLTFAEKQIIEVLRLQKQGLSNERTLEAIVLIVRPLSAYLRNLCYQLGIHHITGKPLLTDGR